MLVPEALVHLAKPWADLYSDSPVLETIVTFVHIAALVVGGGVAIAVDRGTLRAARAREDATGRARQLLDLGGSHRVVITSLVFTVISGLLLLASDLKTFLGSLVFWTKMLLVVLLLANGLMMQRAEERASWPKLRRAAFVSLILWFAITFAGVALVNVS